MHFFKHTSMIEQERKPRTDTVQVEQNTTWITCAVCGYHYDPAENPSCGACPLHKGCSMTCCPNCGTSNINPAASVAASWAKKVMKGI